MMKATLCAATFASALSGPVHALSCVQPHAARTFQNLAAADERYVVLLGAFDFVVPPTPPNADRNNPLAQNVIATFEGQGLAATQFGRVPPLQVTIQTSCAGPWCGAFPVVGEEVLAFVEQTADGYLLTMGPCGGTVFRPESAPLAAACMRGEACDVSR